MLYISSFSEILLRSMFRIEPDPLTSLSCVCPHTIRMLPAALLTHGLMSPAPPHTPPSSFYCQAPLSIRRLQTPP